MKSLSDTFRKTMPSLLGKQGVGWGDLRLLLESWEEIIGSDYARVTTPVAIKFPTVHNADGKQVERREGTLSIAAPAALRTEIQHNSTMVIERINRVFGYTAIAKLHLVPASLAQAPAALPPAKPVALPAGLLEDIDDPELKERLQSLASRMGTTG